MTFNSLWWSVELPQDWQGHSEGACVTFQAKPPCGALQISAARRNGEIVTDQDLREFAKDRQDPTAQPNRVIFGAFSGLSASCLKGGMFWVEWWLRSEELMMYVTYNVAQGNESKEFNVVQSILASMLNGLREN
jgi:hypothetical protein